MEDDPSQVSQGSFVFVVNGEASVAAANPNPSPADHEQKPGKKRPHLKSRRGCLVCKRRRVKCDEQFPCSNCLKRNDRCIHSNTPNRGNELTTYISRPQLSSSLAVDNGTINLLHLELFSHFQRDLVDSLTFPEIWEQVLPWSFQEPYIMCAILCLAATHLSTLQPQVPRYSDAAIRLLGKSASLFSEKVSCAVTAQDGEALIAVSVLMHYITWGNTEFIEKQQRLLHQNGNGTLTEHLSSDPLLQLSFGVRGILYEAYRVLSGSNSVFLAASIYTPRHAIAEAILQQGEDPWRFVNYFMDIYNDHRYQLLRHGDRKKQTRNCLYANRCHDDTTLGVRRLSTGPQEEAFEGIAQRLSLLFCLVAMSNSTTQSVSQVLIRLQPDIERLFFSFPIHYSGAFRESALRGDSEALILLCHFYRAARILLTSRGTWWAQQRSRVIESLILQELTTRGLGTCVLSERP